MFPEFRESTVYLDIESYFKIRLYHAHIDLRYVLFSLGFRGGLKGCERQLVIDRGDLKDINDFFAVLLLEDYQRSKDQRALDTLLAYNIQDTVTLENLMVTADNMKLKDTLFYEGHQLSLPDLPVNPFRVDMKTVQRIKNSPRYGFSNGWY